MENSIQEYASHSREDITWFKPFTLTFNNNNTKPEWFKDGLLNACYNTIDRHASKQPDKIALIYNTNSNDTIYYTFSQALNEIIRISNYLDKNKRTCVTVYMNMCPEAVFTILACARIGIPHNVVFGGYNSESLAMRVKDSKSDCIFTVGKSFREKRVVDFYANVVIASTILKKESCDFFKEIVVFNQEETLVKSEVKVTLWNSIKDDGLDDFIPCKPVSSENPLFYLYTSGSTGTPKGLVHTTGGYLSYVNYSCRHSFNLNENSVFCCTADLGWITGHSFVVYGPLSIGCTTIIFDGIPSSPKLRLFELINKCKVTHLYTAPTVIRTLKKILTKDLEDGNIKENNNKPDEKNKSKKLFTALNESIKEISTEPEKNEESNTEKKSSATLNETINEISTKQNEELKIKKSSANNYEVLCDKTLKSQTANEKNYKSEIGILPENLLQTHYDMTIDEMMCYTPESFYRPNTGFTSFGYDLSSLEILGSVGEPINRDAYIWFKKTFGPYLPLIDTYWQTEAGGILLSPIPYKSYPIPECAALPLPGLFPLVLNQELDPVKDGCLGTLFFKSSWPGIARTILNNNERYLKAYFYNGMYNTGDQAIKSNNIIFIKGRADDVLNIAGHRLSTAEIESACCTLKDTSEAAVVSVEDEITGNAMIIFICTNKSPEIAAFNTRHTLRDRIGPIAKPKHVFCVKELPKTRTGKIMRRVLRDLLEGRELGDLSTCCNVESIDEISRIIRSK